MRRENNSIHNLVHNIVIVNLNMLCMLMTGVISSNEDRGLIIQCMGIREGEEMSKSLRNDQRYTISHAVSAIA